MSSSFKSKMPPTSYIAFLRAVNVGCTGNLPVSDLLAHPFLSGPALHFANTPGHADLEV